MNNKSIFKYQINRTGTTQVRMPVGAKILTVNEQYGELIIHALVTNDTNIGTELRTVESVMTGESITKPIKCYTYIGTVLMGEGAFIVHVFEYKD